LAGHRAGGCMTGMHDLSGMEVAELLALYRSILAELRGRGVIRTDNAPAGDYAEYLVAIAFKGELAPNAAEKGWDVKTADGARLQVKARVVSEPARRSQRQLSPFRSFGFDEAVIMLLSERDYSVARAVRLPRAVVEKLSVNNSHVNGHILHATEQVLDDPAAVDVTDALRAAGGNRAR
jgi:hypothetical protein